MATRAHSGGLESIDDLSAALIIQLQLEDAERLFSSSKGKTRDGEVSDSELALQMFVRELELDARTLADRRMTRSIAVAVQRDGNVLAAALSEEQIAARDRDMACQLGGIQASSGVKPWTVTSEEMDEEIIDKLAALWVSPFWERGDSDNALSSDETVKEADQAKTSPESSQWASTRRNGSFCKTYRCAACQEDKNFVEVIRVPCSHEYCRECLQDLFRSSMTDESLFPPRCCRQPIALTFVRIFLTTDLVRQYEQKKIELDTMDKTYCCSPSCSAFIRSDDISGDNATCKDCGMLTCTICKSAAHDGDCPADTALQQLLDTATENGWQRCYNCRRLVELDTGCNHMICKCGGQFCYICGQRWKTCLCAQWDEDRLVARANQVVARRHEPAGPARDERVTQAIHNLRTRHECDHTSWQYVRGSHRCEECYHTLPSYIFECQQCRIQACNRCRRNRL